MARKSRARRDSTVQTETIRRPVSAALEKVPSSLLLDVLLSKSRDLPLNQSTLMSCNTLPDHTFALNYGIGAVQRHVGVSALSCGEGTRHTTHQRKMDGLSRRESLGRDNALVPNVCKMTVKIQSCLTIV